MKFFNKNQLFFEDYNNEYLNLFKENKLVNSATVLDELQRIDINWNIFSKKKRHYVYLFFVKTNFVFFEKILPKRLLDYSGSYFKNKKNFINLLLKSTIRGGKQLTMLKHLNKCLNGFYYLFNTRFESLKNKFNTYNVYFDIADQNPNFFDINVILKSILDLNDALFNIRVIKFTKSERKRLKVKKKFFFEVVYLPKHKRIKNVLKLIHRHAHQYNNYNYHERLLMSFCNAFFLQKNSFLYQRKVFMYRNSFSNSKNK